MNAEHYTIKNKVRVITAASLFDGHDAAINIMRRLIQDMEAEVIHLGHNRSVAEVVDAAIQEDAQAIALSSYQGGHIEYFSYAVDLLKEAESEHIRIFGGGGGVIVANEVEHLHNYGVEKIYTPEDGRRMGLVGMIEDLVRRCDYSVLDRSNPPTLEEIQQGKDTSLARAITFAEQDASKIQHLLQPSTNKIPVLGITGTGGAGKSSFTDEIIRRFIVDHPDRRIAVLSIDPTRRRTGGALLGDRIRMNSVREEQVFSRSLSTGSNTQEISPATQDAITILQNSNFDLIIVETSGIGQGSSAVIDISDFSIMS